MDLLLCSLKSEGFIMKFLKRIERGCMKKTMVFLFLLGVLGCMHKPIETKKVFELVKGGESAQALTLLKSKMLSKFESYTGSRHNAWSNNPYEYTPTLRSLIEGYEASLNFCEEILQPILKVTYIKGRYQPNHYNFGRMKEKFMRNCSLDRGPGRIEEIRKISHVDLSGPFDKINRNYQDKIIELNENKNSFQKVNLLNENKKKIDEKLYRESPAYFHKNLCQYTYYLKTAKESLAKEKRAAMYSGVVDSKKMYQLGRMIQINEDFIKKDSSLYKKKFGKAWGKVCEK